MRDIPKLQGPTQLPLHPMSLTGVVPYKNVKSSTDFSSVFTEQVVEHKNARAISGNETGIPFSTFSKMHCIFFPVIPIWYHRKKCFKTKIQAQSLCLIKPSATGFTEIGLAQGKPLFWQSPQLQALPYTTCPAS